MRNFIKRHKIHFVVLVVLGFVALGSGVILIMTPVAKLEPTASITTSSQPKTLSETPLSARLAEAERFGSARRVSPLKGERSREDRQTNTNRQFVRYPPLIGEGTRDGSRSPSAAPTQWSGPRLDVGATEGAGGGLAQPMDSETPLPVSPTATLQINSQAYTLNIVSSTTLYEAMIELQQNNPDFSFNGKNFSGLGFFVEEINGTRNDPGNNLYWVIYKNNKPSTQGASQLIIIPNDLIQLRYEKPNF